MTLQKLGKVCVCVYGGGEKRGGGGNLPYKTVNYTRLTNRAAAAVAAAVVPQCSAAPSAGPSAERHPETSR